MAYAACAVPAAPVRKKPSHQSEMVNQLLFGEMMEILKVKDEQWLKISSLHDKYEGWIRLNHIEMVTELLAKEDDYCMAYDLINSVQVGDTKMNVPAGSTLPAFHEGEGRFGNFSYQFWDNSYFRKDARPGRVLVEQLTKPWLHAPYLWGGRTFMGVDCSGFTQVIFKMMGIELLRDSHLQADQGIRILDLSDAQCGDLAFFDDGKGKVVHVGILLNDNEIIHASGKVRIDTFNQEGIINVDSGKRTHGLRSVRRYW